jgi:flagellar protein FlaI
MEKSAVKKQGAGFLGTRKKAVHVMAPMAGQGKRFSPSAITEMPPITDPNQEVLEIYPVQDPYSFIRIIYDTQENEHLYQVIEPTLSEKDKKVLNEVRDALSRTMSYEFDHLTGMTKDEYLRHCVESFVRSRGLKMGPIDRKRLEYYIIRDFIGNSVVDVMVRDDEIEDISCDGYGIPLYVYHRKYESMKSNIVFTDEDLLNSFVVTLSQRSAKQISVASPILDGTMQEGHRVQATYSKEVTTRGSTFTIRRFKEKPFTPVDMLKYKTVSPEMMAYIWLGVENGESMIIVGGTASGKTSTLNSISLFIPPAAKIVSIEDTREINLPHENWIPSMTRSGIGEKDAEGHAAGEIDMYDLVRASLRQRPNYILVGEVRGKEAYVMFQAMATGHSTYSTMHADSVKSMVNRLENPPINCPRILLTALRNVMIQGQVRVGNDLVRRMRQLTEIVGFEPETNELITNTVYEWDQATDRFLFKGHSFLFDKIMEMKSLTQAEMMEEFERRIEIVRYLLAKDLRDHRQIWAITNAYYRDPTRTINRVRREMQEVGRGG